MSSDNTQQTLLCKVYRLDPSRRIPMLIVTGIATFVILIFLFPVFSLLLNDFSSGTVCFAVFLLGTAISPAALIYYLTKHIRLVTTSEGIDYYQFGYSIHSTWENIERIGQVPAGLISAEGLILRQPGLKASKLQAWSVKMGRQDRVIPLTIFMWWWRESELGQDLKKYAPHLFAQE